MVSNDTFLTFIVEDQLAPLEIEARRMFGSWGLYHRQYFFGIVSDGRLYLKTTDATRSPFIEAGMEPFRPSPQQTLKNYYEVPIDVVEDAATLQRWVQTAISTKLTST